MAPSETLQLFSTWVLVGACCLSLALTMLGSFPMQGRSDEPAKNNAKWHVRAGEHERMKCSLPPDETSRAGGTSPVARWGKRELTEADLAGVASRCVCEKPFQKNFQTGLFENENLLGMRVVVSDSPLGEWMYGEEPTGTTSKAPIDDKSAIITARTIWGAISENTQVHVEESRGYKCVTGELLHNGLGTGVYMYAVLDGSTIAHARGLTHLPYNEDGYTRATISESIDAWNKTAGNGTFEVFSWTENYHLCMDVDGSFLLIPGYLVKGRDGVSHSSLPAIDTGVLRVWGPGQSATVPESAQHAHA